MSGHSRANLFPQFSFGPVGGLDLAVQEQVLLGGHVFEEDVILHAHAKLSADAVDVALHVSTINLNGARGRGEQASQKRPAHTAPLLVREQIYYYNDTRGVTALKYTEWITYLC